MTAPVSVPATGAAPGVLQSTNIDCALAPYGLCSHDVGGEGDCQFRALAHHL